MLTIWGIGIEEFTANIQKYILQSKFHFQGAMLETYLQKEPTISRIPYAAIALGAGRSYCRGLKTSGGFWAKRKHHFYSTYCWQDKKLESFDIYIYLVSMEDSCTVSTVDRTATDKGVGSIYRPVWRKTERGLDTSDEIKVGLGSSSSSSSAERQT